MRNCACRVQEQLLEHVCLTVYVCVCMCVCVFVCEVILSVCMLVKLNTELWLYSSLVPRFLRATLKTGRGLGDEASFIVEFIYL